MSDTSMSFVDDQTPLDPERALIIDYLSHELPIAEALVVGRRLESDAAFRGRVQPIIDVWTRPLTYSTPEEIRAMREGLAPLPEGVALTEAELEEGWNQFLMEERRAAGAVAVAAPAPPAALTLVHPTPPTAASTQVAERRIRRQRSFRSAVSIAAGVIVLLGVRIAIAVPLNALDHEVTEAPHEWVVAWFHRSIVQRGLDTRHIDLDGGSKVTLSPQSQLVYRPVARVPGEVLNLQGSAIIEISEHTASASLYTPEARVTLTPGRYVVRAVDAKSPMVIGVLAGSATIYPRATHVHLDLHVGQYGQAEKNQAPVLLVAAPPGLPRQ